MNDDKAYRALMWFLNLLTITAGAVVLALVMT